MSISCGQARGCKEYNSGNPGECSGIIDYHSEREEYFIIHGDNLSCAVTEKLNLSRKQLPILEKIMRGQE